MTDKGKNFEEILFDCTYNTFVEFLGVHVTVILLEHIGVKSLRVEAEDFAEALEKVLKSASYVLEKRILENLYLQIGKSFQEKEGKKFIDYVNEAKAQFIAEAKKVAVE